MIAPVRVLSDNGPVRVELARWRDQLVVVKRMQMSSPTLEERLRREAEVVQKLKHANIVPLLATEGGALIYAYCAGVNLEEALAGGAIRVKRAAKIITDVLNALGYAHGMGVIHFDVKPSNILIKGEQALLTDFGFAKDMALTAITHQGMFLGTPNYMAPEQFRGDRSDPRSDVYSSGAVLYHMLRGEPPYGRQVLRFLAGDARLKLEPLPTPAKTLEAVIVQALMRDPEARFKTTGAMLAAIKEALDSP